MAIKDSNLGTCVDIDNIGNNSGDVAFVKAFWIYGSSIKAFRHCRPIISIDGTHLYGKYKHKLLIACGMGIGHHIIPLSFAIVYEESTKSLSWFLRRVKDFVIQK
jgi:hypothetical protein